MPITKLDLNGPEVKKELSRIEAQNESAFDADITAEGVEAEISTVKKGWGLAAYVKRKWSGETSAGGRIRKTF
jgi:hypothetical protein